MTARESASRRVAADRKSKAESEAAREAWKRKWWVARAIRDGFTADQLQAEETALSEEVARRVAAGEVQRLKGSAMLNRDPDLSNLLTGWIVNERV